MFYRPNPWTLTLPPTTEPLRLPQIQFFILSTVLSTLSLLHTPFPLPARFSSPHLLSRPRVFPWVPPPFSSRQVSHHRSHRGELLRREYMSSSDPSQPPHGFNGQLHACWTHGVTDRDVKTIRQGTIHPLSLPSWQFLVCDNLGDTMRQGKCERHRTI